MYQRVLAIGAHPDDIEYCCGGTVLGLLDKGAQVKYLVFSRCLDLPRNKNIIEEYNEVLKLMGLQATDATLLDFPNRRLYTIEAEVRSTLEEIRDSFKPDLVLCPSLDDINQDHRTVALESQKVFKQTTLLGYEVLTSSVNFFPNYFVPLTEDLVQRKLELCACYKSQAVKQYSQPEAIRGTMLHRGAQV
ncbi:MAG: PIG-L deacetylase family protein, partial [Candidatus Hodarchaeota archaeon]